MRTHLEGIVGFSKLTKAKRCPDATEGNKATDVLL